MKLEKTRDLLRSLLLEILVIWSLKVNKEPFSKDFSSNFIEQAPPPGAYTVKNYDIGIKVIREEEEAKIFGVKKVPFGAAKPRFEEVSARQRGEFLKGNSEINEVISKEK